MLHITLNYNEKKLLVWYKLNTMNPLFDEVKINLCNMSQSILLFDRDLQPNLFKV